MEVYGMEWYGVGLRMNKTSSMGLNVFVLGICIKQQAVFLNWPVDNSKAPPGVHAGCQAS
eukprot:scaffold496469_cov39-Prasinocladus_malaysianus.AAC.1